MSTKERRAPVWSRKGYVILAMVFCALLVFAMTTQTWLTVELPEQPVQTADLRIAGSDAATAVTALALAALAGAVAASIAGAISRVVVAVIVLGASVGVVIASLAVISAPEAAATGRIAETIGVIGSSAQVQLTVFPVICTVTGVLLGLSAVLLLAAGRHWSRSKRFENTAGAASTGQEPASSEDSVDEPVDEIDSWDQLSRGKDPTR